jgi:tetratricopeptide (TPR) repeat protein
VDGRGVKTIPILVLAAACLTLAPFCLPRKTLSLPLFSQPSMPRYTVEDTLWAMAGMRRLAADMAYVQMLQYYGTDPEEEHEHESGHIHVDLGEEAWADRRPGRIPNEAFPELAAYCGRATDLDPYFDYVYLFGAGALAFNLNRGDEALSLLAKGVRFNPNQTRFHLYAAAAAYRKSFEVDRVIQLLEQAAADPECPSMLQNILANIYKKKGDWRNAARIYLRLLDNSRDPSYVEVARRNLEAIDAKLR